MLSRDGGFAVYLTGLSGAGKSTLAADLLGRIESSLGRPVTRLDGELAREKLAAELGFSRADRERNVLRTCYVASEIVRHGGIVICAQIAPYKAARAAGRALVERFGPFIEVYVSTPLSVCELRDPKGLYASARAGSVKQVSGVDTVYEIPRQPDCEVDTSLYAPNAASLLIWDCLIRRGLIPRQETPNPNEQNGSHNSIAGESENDFQ